MKVYVQEESCRNSDGDRLIKVKTYTQKPKRFSYIIFIEK